MFSGVAGHFSKPKFRKGSKFMKVKTNMKARKHTVGELSSRLPMLLESLRLRQ
jgi:hypothetical protein